MRTPTTRRIYLVVSLVAGCASSETPAPEDAGITRDAQPGDAGPADAGTIDAGTADAGLTPTCVTLSGPNPRRIELFPGLDNGSYDPTLASGPDGRLVMAYSRVVGAAGVGQVSTHLASSDDGGETWCDLGVVNAAQPVAIADLPARLRSAVSAHWSHEVSSLAYVPAAPAAERWRLTWHRYLHVDDGVPGNDDRHFEHGWIGSRAAASPEALAGALEKALFSGATYYLDASIEAYNDLQVGPPELRLDLLHADLAGCLTFSETGMQAYDGRLYLSALCARGPGANDIVLLSEDPNDGTWRFEARLLTPQDAARINSVLTGFSATDLSTDGAHHYLMVSPVAALYAGCMVFRIDLATGTLFDADDDGPDVLLFLGPTPGTLQTGVCTFDQGASATGIIYGDAFPTDPQFNMFASGLMP